MDKNNSVKSDLNLLAELRDGSQEALLAIYDRYYDKLFFYASKGLSDKFIIEDLLQDTFTYIWEKRTKLILTHSLSTYLHTIVKYKVFQQIKNTLNREEGLSRFGEHLQQTKELTPHQLLENKEALKFLYFKLDELPEKCKEVFILSRIDRLSHKEIADKLGISTKTVENHITKAVKILNISARVIFILFFSE
ncbi:RNA polymerase sigma-70 factor, ECF subfamily [Sphingobacterium nematocida]|uniref:RNA polymerase sigma-70 factor, ECF subfamily n=1 Tax=Sphingobacterium nematocida TaxID=1513896 RepID=A0A1T5BQD6_9SPHI|nr:RNA polymerase sigma-70 factor [Sphingobacterium nematocida]SKB49365.1 RNA polymerase sigma-70 factor, ECF subfamily [Sphingobacterium nematocida]